ncbi:MAG: DUF4266 domain-containing protein [Myxococcota bacterium]
MRWALLAGVLVACSPPRPWERELHADPAMTFGDEAAVESSVDHAIDYREGAGRATRTGGGGCGCN